VCGCVLDKERVANHDSIVTQFKELIRVQDVELAELRTKLTGYDVMSSEFEQLKQQVRFSHIPMLCI